MEADKESGTDADAVALNVETEPTTNLEDPTPTNKQGEPQRLDSISPSNDNAPQGPIEAYSDGDGYFGRRNKRIITLCSILLFFGVLGIGAWLDFDKFDRMNKSFNGSFVCHGIGLLFIIFGTVLTIALNAAKIMNKCADDDIADNNPTLNLLIFVVFYVFGALMYFIGGCSAAAAFNDSKTDLIKLYKNMEPSALAGVIFCESLFISSITILVGLDVYKNILNNYSDKNYYQRELILFIIYIFIGSILFFSNASCGSSGNNGSYNTVAAGWFFILLSLILIILLETLTRKIIALKLGYKKFEKIINLILIGILLFGSFLAMIGQGSINAFDSGMAAYNWGFGLFVLLIFTFTSFDLVLGDFVNCC